MKESTIELILLLLKYISIIIGGFFGVYGLVLDFKNKDGVITKAGKIALSVILLTTIITISTLSFEVYLNNLKEEKASMEALNRIKQNELIINQISRSLYQIEEVMLDYEIEVPIHNNHLLPYSNRLNKSLSPYLNSIEDMSDKELNDLGIIVNRNYFNDKVKSIRLNKNSIFLPSKEKEKTAYEIFNDKTFDITFNKKQMPLDSIIKYNFSWLDPGDLTMDFVNEGDPNGINLVEYDFNLGVFTFTGYDMQTESHEWIGNGSVVSVMDLLGGQMIIQIDNDLNLYSNLKHSDEQSDLKYIRLNFNKGISIDFFRSDLVKVKGIDDQYIYVFNFPKTIAELEGYYSQ